MSVPRTVSLFLIAAMMVSTAAFAKPKTAKTPRPPCKHESMVTLTLGGESPRQEFKDVAKSGSMVGLSAGFRATNWLAAGMDFTYMRSAGVHNGAVIDIPNDPGTGKPVNVTLVENWNIMNLGAYARIFVFERGRFAPYVRLGGGSYNIRYSQDVSAASAATTLSGTEQTTKPGISAGLGARYRILGGSTLGIEVVYHQIFANDVRMNLLTTGATLGFGPAGN